MNPKVHIHDITANNGVPFRLKVVVDDEPGMTTVSFYDRRGNETEDGNFITVMNAALAAQRPMGMGFQLMPPNTDYNREMRLDGPCAWDIVHWLNRQLDMGVWFAE